MAYINERISASSTPGEPIRIRSAEGDLNELVSTFAACNERLESTVERLLGPQPPNVRATTGDSPREVRQGLLGELENAISHMREQANRYMTALDKLAGQV